MSAQFQLASPVRVYKTEALDDIVRSSNTAPMLNTKVQIRPHTISAKEKPKYTEDLAAIKVLQGKQRRLKKYWETAERERIELERVNRIAKEKKQEREERKFSELLKALDGEQEIVDSVGEMLYLKSLSEKRKREQLYKEWNKKVYKPIQGQIDNALGKRSVSEIQARRNRSMQEYLDTSNTKVGVFRDIIEKEEYDPLKERGACIRFDQSKIRDPCKQDIEKLEIEQKMTDALNPDSKRIVPQSRDVLDLLKWDKLDCTPYARYSGTEQKVFRRPAQHIEGCPIRSSTSSNLYLDHYNPDSIMKNRTIVKAQFFPGGVRITNPDRYVGRRLTDHWPEA